MKTLTIYTPTYNRAHTLVRTYESLTRQTSDDFEWLIIDDGSTDNTREIVKQWQSQSPFRIRYIYKSNGGLHTGYNVAISNIDTELCMCCDSDDYLPDNAVEIILQEWRINGSNRLAGIIGLDYIAGTDKPIGGYFSADSCACHFLEIGNKLHHKGDVKMIHRTELLKPIVPMQSFAGEKNFNPIYIFLKLNPYLDYWILNKNLCNVDYQPQGMSANIFYQFRNSPKSFAEIRKARMGHPRVKLTRKILDAAHLISSVLLSKNLNTLKGTPNIYLCVPAIPLGIGIWAITLYKTRKKH